MLKKIILISLIFVSSHMSVNADFDKWTTFSWDSITFDKIHWEWKTLKVYEDFLFNPFSNNELRLITDQVNWVTNNIHYQINWIEANSFSWTTWSWYIYNESDVLSIVSVSP